MNKKSPRFSFRFFGLKHSSNFFLGTLQYLLTSNIILKNKNPCAMTLPNSMQTGKKKSKNSTLSDAADRRYSLYK